MTSESLRKPLVSVTADHCRFDYYVGPGNGGQKKQKTKSGVRCTHIASGAVGKCHEDRMQAQNKKEAFKRMVDTKEFQNWIRLESARASGKLEAIEKQVDEEMKRTRTDVKDENGRWVELKDDSKLQGE